MPEVSFLDSENFRKIMEEYYPESLINPELRFAAYREQLRPFSRAAEAAVTVVEKKVVRPYQRSNGNRMSCFLDRPPGGGFTKSPESIDDKIFRYLSGKKVAGQEPINAQLKKRLRESRGNQEVFLETFFHSLPNVMNDLARFRIVANLLSDICGICEKLHGTELAPPEVSLDQTSTEDRIEADRWERGAGGHRAVHMKILVDVNGWKVPVELLVMSLLELGWEVKSHLLYELVRRGEDDRVDKKTKFRVRAMSDAIYVADSLFDDVFRILKREGGKE